MSLFYCLALLVLSIYALPLVWYEWIGSIKVWYRAHLAQRYGAMLARQLYREYRRDALKRGVSSAEIDAAFAEMRDEIVDDFGRSEAERILGSKTPIEMG